MRRVGACSGGTTRPTTSRFRGYRRSAAQPSTRSTASSGAPTRSSTARGPACGRRSAELPSTSGRASSSAGWRPECPTHPVIAALVHAAGAQQLPVEELRPYMASMRMDCGRLRIQTREELERYMDGSGASVGRVMAVILGAPDESERLGTSRRRVPADELPARPARGLRARSDLPSGRRARTARCRRRRPCG